MDNEVAGSEFPNTGKSATQGIDSTSLRQDSSTSDANTRHRHSDRVNQLGDVETSSAYWGTDVSAIAEDLLSLTNEFRAQGSGTPRRELTIVARQLEEASRALDAAKIVIAGIMESEHVAAAPLGDSYGWSADPERPEFKNLVDFMVQTLNITAREARQRIALGKAIRPKNAFSSEPSEPPHPHLAASIENGVLSSESANIILNTAKRIAAHAPSRCDIGDMQTDSKRWAGEAEETMCTQALIYDPDQLRRIGKHCEILANQDGAEPTEQELALKQGLFYKGCHNKLHRLEAIVTDTQFEGLSTTLSALITPTRDGKLHLGGTTSPDTSTPLATSNATASNATSTANVGPGGNDGTQSKEDSAKFIARYGIAPTRSQAERSAQSLEPTHAQTLLEALIIATREGGMSLTSAMTTEDGAPNAIPKARQTIIAVIDEKDLVIAPPIQPASRQANQFAAPGAGFSAKSSPKNHGAAFFQRTGPVSPGEIRRLACNADIIPVVFGSYSQPLDVGRASRLFTTAQRMALNARDKGCVFPGCTTPLAFCEAHHVNPWGNGGDTNLSNGALLCSYHHHVIHAGSWTMTIVENIPWIIPPPWIDPRQRPLRNTIHTFGQRANTS